MTISEVIRQAWVTLEGEWDRTPGLYERRVHAHSGYELFAGLSRPEKKLRLTLAIPSSVATDGLERETTGFHLVRRFEPAEKKTLVVLELDHHAFRDVFEVMAEDVAACIIKADAESAAVAAMRVRLDRWERFMRASGPEGLSREKQIGLFGELTFLATLLDVGIAPQDAVDWWHGPVPENQDFQNGSRTLEVKSTTANASTVVRIANELQLDDSDCEQLYLLHLWLKELEGAGTALPAMIEDLRNRLAGSAQPQFNDRLVEAGYHDIHRALYERTGYLERERSYYIVEAAFPRISQSDLRDGVSNVRYEINLAGFQQFRRPEAEVIAALAEENT